MSFQSLGLSTHLLKKLDELGFDETYPIQEEAIPTILDNKDILGIAPTGSGKTAAYVLPILMKLRGERSARNRHIKHLVLTPTRELAIQVNEVFERFTEGLPNRVKTMAVYGGVSINPQMIEMQNVDVLIATPGRLLDLLDSNALHLDSLKTLVLDEADKMLNVGFEEEMNRLLALMPAERQNLLFSATLSPKIADLQKILLKDPKVIEVEAKENPSELIKQSVYFVSDERKGPLFRYIILKNDFQHVLVFVSTIKKADRLVDKLKKNGIKGMAIHSDKSQGARTDALTKFKHGRIRVLVATDLIARGIDIEFLPCVINYELPRSPKEFIHRIGRTGRAENPGEAISIVTPSELTHFKLIQKKMGTYAESIECEDLDLHGY